MYGRVVWVDTAGLRRAKDTVTRTEHKATCRALRRQHRTILRATPPRKGQ